MDAVAGPEIIPLAIDPTSTGLPDDCTGTSAITAIVPGKI
jgi:hypothetical protein